jgi:hypothetical protein
VLWQAYRLRQAGRGETYGTTNRGFWYRPLLPILRRAGELAEHPEDELYTVYQKACLLMIGQYRLFRYSDLRFPDHRPDLRGIGTKRPEIVLLCEKVSLAPYAQQLGEKFGITWQVFHGQPKLLDSEYLAMRLRETVDGPVHVIAYVDYDYSGWIIAEAFVQQLALYAVRAGSLKYVVTPDRFTAAEISRLAHPILATKQQAVKLAAWVEKTGGIDGKPRGLYSNDLVPFERVEAIVGRLMREVGRLE